jgi:hypothetical protein
LLPKEHPLLAQNQTESNMTHCGSGKSLPTGQGLGRALMNVSPELQPTDAACHMSLIGMLRWIVEIGHVDVCLECSMLSSHLALPRESHLCQLFQVFACCFGCLILAVGGCDVNH